MELTKFNQTKIEILKLYEILEDVHKQLKIALIYLYINYILNIGGIAYGIN